MNDYSKWDKIVDSDEELENRQRHYKSAEVEAQEKRTELKDQIDNWLRWQIGKLGRNASDPATDQLYASMPELAAKRKKPIMPRQVTKEEREVLAMLIAVGHFEEGDTNLNRHPQMLDMVRHHRWLEEDPGTLELLCRLHNNVMKEGGGDGGHGSGGRQKFEDPETTRMRNMLLSTVNTLAAPRQTKCSSGLLELFNTICTPTTEDGRELRRKWQTKAFAKDALFDSLFPDLRQFTEDQTDEGYGSDFWIIVALAVLAILGIVGFMVLYSYGVMSPPSRSRVNSTGKNVSNSTLFAAGGSATTNGDLLTTHPAPPMASAPAPPPAPAGDLPACRDLNEGCAYWAETGECVSNAEFMLANCRMSCSVCQVKAPAAAPRAAPVSSEPSASSNVGDARGQEL